MLQCAGDVTDAGAGARVRRPGVPSLGVGADAGTGTVHTLS